MYSFFNKKEKNFTTHMEILEKISNIFKKHLMVNLYIERNILKMTKNRHKKRLSVSICTNNID